MGRSYGEKETLEDKKAHRKEPRRPSGQPAPRHVNEAVLILKMPWLTADKAKMSVPAKPCPNSCLPKILNTCAGTSSVHESHVISACTVP